MLSLCLAPARASMPTMSGLVLRKQLAIAISQPTLLLNTKSVNGAYIINRPTLKLSLMVGGYER